LGALVTFLTIALPSLACMSRLPVFSYSKNNCKEVGKGLEVGNGPKGGVKLSQISVFQGEIGKGLTKRVEKQPKLRLINSSMVDLCLSSGKFCLNINR